MQKLPVGTPLAEDSATLLRHRRWQRGVAVGSMLMLAVAGCSSNDDATSSTTSSVNLSVTTGSTSSETVTTNTAGVAGVTAAAQAFLATLDDDQKASAQLDFTQDNATAWSNLPCGSSCRVGVEFNTLSDEQLTAAKTLLQAAQNTGGGVGYDQAMQILLADDVLGAAGSTGGGGGGGGTPPSGSGGAMPTDGGMPSGSSGAMPTDGGTPSGGGMPSGTDGASGGGGGMPSGTDGAPGGGGAGGGGGGYSSGNYYLAILGDATDTGSWQLHFGGHHLAVNITYKDGAVAGASPYFVGVEPKTWTADDGTTYAPLDIMKDGMLDLVQSLSTEQLATAKLSETFTDVLLGPDQDGAFPETKEGIKVSDLSDDQKKLVITAMDPWISVVDETTAATLMDTYEAELDDTYISYSGNTDLLAQGDYVRIDGPSVWVEFVCQNGVVYSDQIHYHTVYRDHTRDYGGEFSF